MELLHKIIDWIIKIMRPDTTDRITEDTAGLQRKIVYRGKLQMQYPTYSQGSNSYFTWYLQEDAVSTYVAGSMSVTIPELDVTNTYSVDAVKTYENDGLNYQSFKLPIQTGFSSASYPNYFQEYWNVKLSSNAGKLKITFDIKTSQGLPDIFTNVYGEPTYIYYVVYATKITDEAVL